MALNKIILAGIIGLATNAFSSVTNTYVGKVMGVRVESTTGLISMASQMEDGDPGCSRVWLDLLKEEGKAAYSTFLMAFAADKTVHIRAVSGNNKRYGACKFYDVFIPRQ